MSAVYAARYAISESDRLRTVRSCADRLTRLPHDVGGFQQRLRLTGYSASYFLRRGCGHVLDALCLRRSPDVCQAEDAWDLRTPDYRTHEERTIRGKTARSLSRRQFYWPFEYSRSISCVRTHPDPLQQSNSSMRRRRLSGQPCSKIAVQGYRCYTDWAWRMTFRCVVPSAATTVRGLYRSLNYTIFEGEGVVT
jgi:hypothetical protein